MKKTNNKGITLVSLVITIIVMLILAGVGLSMVTGEGSVIDKAIEASEKQKIAAFTEELNLILNDYNMKSVVEDAKTGGQSEAFTNFLEELKNPTEPGKEKVIDEYTYTGEYLISYKDKWFSVGKEGKSYVVKDNYSVVGDDAGNTIVIAPSTMGGKEENFTLEMEDGKTYIVLDNVNVENFNFDIKSGQNVSIKLVGQNMKIDNKKFKRSAINIAPGGTLNLYVYGTVEVNSGYGGSATGNTPGEGAFAGIRVPKDATLNLYGTGTLTAIGGDAGDGEVSDNISLHAGGGGAGAGIGGSGGKGGAGKNGSNVNNEVCPAGGTGEDCGTINIHDSITVIAYGGGGGSGGTNGKGIGAGAGGYPAAGIGGGGAGGAGATCCAGAGGYSGGAAEGIATPSVNGKQGHYATAEFPKNKGYYMEWQGGGYYEGINSTSGDSSFNMSKKLVGGKGGPSYWPGHTGGNGGTAGKGGEVNVYKDAKVYAYNGNMYTDGTSYNNGENQAVIYLQSGKAKEIYTTYKNGWYDWPRDTSYDVNVHTNKPYFKVVTVSDVVPTPSGYVNTKNVGKTKTFTDNMYLSTEDLSKQGIGSGAGYIELNNGKYTIKEDNNFN